MKYLIVLLLGVMLIPSCVSLRSAPIGASIEITWTSSGDNGSYGLAKCLEIAITTDSTLPLSEWSRLYCDELPPPIEPGLTQSYTITGLESDTEYFIHLWTIDWVDNRSGKSNRLAKSTKDIIPPLTVTDLR